MNKYTLPLIDYHDTPQQLELVFLDEEARETHSVKWNKRKYNPELNDFEDDPEKIRQVEQWSKDFLGVPVDKIGSVLDKDFTIYSYPTFDSMWEVASKFDKSMKGQIIQGEIDRVESTPTAIVIWFRYEGELYLSRMKHEMKIGDQTYTDGTKKNKRYADFKSKFGLVKMFGKNTFSEIQSIVKEK